MEMVDCASAIVNTNQVYKNQKKINSNKLKMINTELYNKYCSFIHCKINDLNADESALIRLRFRLWAKTLAKVNLFNLKFLKFETFFFKNPDIYSIKTNAMSIVTQIPYKNLNIDLNQYQSSIRVSEFFLY